MTLFLIFTFYALAEYMRAPEPPGAVCRSTWQFIRAKPGEIIAVLLIGSALSIVPGSIVGLVFAIISGSVSHWSLALAQSIIQSYIGGFVTTFWLFAPYFHLEANHAHGQG